MTTAGSILIVDNDPIVPESVGAYFDKMGFSVLTARNGQEVLRFVEKEPIAFVILDMSLPDRTGVEICAAIRRFSRVPIIMMSDHVHEEEIIRALRCGADDYITKPFRPDLLHALMQAIARRASEDMRPLAQQFSWGNGDLVVRCDSREVFKKGAKVNLTPSEWRILSSFIAHPRLVLSRNDLLNICFDHAFDGYDRIIDTHVKNLRRKIEDDPKNPAYIRTVHGVGYQFFG